MFDPLAPLLVFLLTAGLKEFCARVLKREVDARWSVVIAALASAVVLFANQVAVLLPAALLPVAQQLVQLLVIIASAFGVHATVRMVVRRGEA